MRRRFTKRSNRLSRPHLAALAFAEQAASFPELTTTELRDQPLRHFTDARVDGAARRDIVQRHRRNGLHAIAKLHVRSGDIARLAQCSAASVARGHPERREDPLLYDIVPTL